MSHCKCRRVNDKIHKLENKDKVRRNEGKRNRMRVRLIFQRLLRP